MTAATPKQIRRSGQCGFSIIECMVALTVLAIGALGVARSISNTLSVSKRTMRHSIAMQLASERLEELAAVDPQSLDETDNSAEADMLVDNITFSRTTTVVVNDDQSRTVTVTVAGSVAELGGGVTLSATYPLWGQL
ncbi:MAG: prepilin-type N-terminal cleavage/methylation domain-containing protein [Bdellovibrionota bacterium]|nr:MAG: prepilin-type N-terminal cleavage/methylation domain-containing protein [Bdellovibrionota bacterium]